MIPIFHAFSPLALSRARALSTSGAEQGNNHPDAAVEGAIHFMALNVTCRLQPVEHFRPLPVDDSSITALSIIWQYARNVFPEAAAGQVRNSMHIDLFNQLQHGLHVNAGWCQQMIG